MRSTTLLDEAFVDTFFAYGRWGHAFYASSRVCCALGGFLARRRALRVDFNGVREGPGRILEGPDGYF